MRLRWYQLIPVEIGISVLEIIGTQQDVILAQTEPNGGYCHSQYVPLSLERSNMNSLKIILNTKANERKVAKTVRGSLKKAFYYLLADFDYELTESEFLRTGKRVLIIRSKSKHALEPLANIFRLDCAIRETDDMLDKVLATRKPFPTAKWKYAVKELVDKYPKTKEVGNLFDAEQKLLVAGRFNGANEVREAITEIIDLRPSDWFLLVDEILYSYGSRLHGNALDNSRTFYHTFQRLRDLLDDMMSIEEDVRSSNYNSIVYGKQRGLSWQYFDTKVDVLFIELDRIRASLTGECHHRLLSETIVFWKEQYRLIFKPLLRSYYINADDFGRTYFLIRQL